MPDHAQREQPTTTYPVSMPKPASARGRSLNPPQVISMLLVFLLLSATGGVLTAGFAMPAVGAASAVTNASAQLFDELPSDFNILEPSQISYIQASDGTEIAQFYAENRIVVPLSEISVNAQNAIVAVEDRRFYQHKGIDPAGMIRALVTNATSDDTQGASTLTQQYVRNVLIEAGLQAGDQSAVSAATAPTIARKLREAKYSLTLEKNYNKQQILEGYLNIAAFGPSTYGIEASARHYFSHSAKDLTIGEAALLAGLTNAPSAYDPVAYPDKAQSRRDWVLDKMFEEEFITAEERDAAKAQPIADMLHITDAVGGCGAAGSAAYFCEYVVNEITGSDLYGETEADRRQVLLRGGLTIRTTLDLSTQAAADAAIQGYVPTGDPSNVKNVIVSVEPGTGRIVSMAQNTNYGDPSATDPTATQMSLNVNASHGGTTNNGFQPGSAFKPFILAQWYRLGKSGYAVVNSDPRTYPASAWTISCAPELADRWKVDNANTSERGNHTIVEATKLSINASYANMETQMDLCDVTSLAASMGVTKVDGSALDPRPSIVLGAQESTPLAMANAYATFAAHGVYCKPIAIDSITDDDGTSLAVPSADCTQVMDTTHADQVTTTLTYVMTSGGTGQTAALSGRPSAGKTGTTDDMDNAWFVGFTPQLATAVWAGFSETPQTMQYLTIGGRYYPTMYGSDLPAPEWRTYMEAALANQPAEPLSIVSLGARSSSSSSGSSSGSGSQDGGANGGEDLGVGSSAGAGGNSVNVGNGSESSGSANSGSEGGTNSGGNG